MRLLLCLLGVTLLAAQRTSTPAQEKCSLEGTVLNSLTGEPIKNVQVLLHDMSGPGELPPGAITGADGKFKVTGLDSGRYRVQIVRPGFTEAARRAGDSAFVLTLTAGQSLESLVYHLSPGAVIAGRVVDEDGDPVVGASVQVLRRRYVEGSSQLMALNAASSDDRGNYRIFNLPTGRYYVSASVTRNPFRVKGLSAATRDVYPMSFYPGVTDLTQASMIRLAEGEERSGVDFRLAPVHAVRIRGRLVPAPTLPNAVNLFLSPHDASRFAAPFTRRGARVDKKGAFDFQGVLPGSYVLVAFARLAGRQETARLPLEVGDTNLDGIELTLMPGVDIAGHVRFDPGTAPDSKPARMYVILRQPGSGLFVPIVNSEVEPEGSFLLKSVPEGEYRVTMPLVPSESYIQSVTYGGMDALTRPLTIGEGAAGPLEIVLSANCGQVEGTVTSDDKPAAGVTVVLIPKLNLPDRIEQIVTDQRGRFVLTGVAPGDYSAYAWDNIEEGEYQDPAFLAQFKDSAVKITVEPKGRQTVDLTLLHAAAQ
jgi:5-hydroxyisourate hydrolase-like protein (transthyretin family)